jgi:hypothetical protein
MSVKRNERRNYGDASIPKDYNIPLTLKLLNTFRLIFVVYKLANDEIETKPISFAR